MAASTWIVVLAAIPLLPLLGILSLRLTLRLLGWSLQSQTNGRRHAFIQQAKREVKVSEHNQQQPQEVEDGWEKVEKNGTATNGQPQLEDDWEGVVGFFHPFCNAGGGGERVLWAAIAATQTRWPKAICAVYTGDHDIDRSIVVSTVKDRFGIVLRPETLQFIYLTSRNFVLANNYPYFTLLGQSLGSLILAYEAFHLLVPDIFIDTMGYAFAVAFCRYLFPSVSTAAYVHYPTISTDMLDSLSDTTGTKGVNAGTGTGWKGWAKKQYWHLFAWVYGWVGRQIDVVMCNSTWTRNHIAQLWKRRSSAWQPTIVYPPCPVEELSAKVKVDKDSESKRQNIMLYIAQFRPEKNHSLILRSFAKYYHSTKANAKLVLVGSVRSNTPDEKHIYNLRLQVRELHIDDATTFICDAPFSLIQEYLQKASVSVNGMYAEHFGIGNVEGLAAGLIPVVHKSGGPYLDIVVPWEGKEIGYHAENEEEYADAFKAVSEMQDDERLEMRLRGRRSTIRFGEEEFKRKWEKEMEVLIGMSRKVKK